MAETSQRGNEAQLKGAPDGISRQHAEPRSNFVRGFLPVFVLGALLLAALLGLFGGGHDPTVTALANGVRLSFTAPQTLRNGMFFEIDAAISTDRAIAKPVLAISGSYLTDITVNTELPEPKDMGFEDGQLTLTFPPMKAGDRLLVKLDGQVNPSLVGGKSGVVAIRDDKAVLAQHPIGLWVFP